MVKSADNLGFTFRETKTGDIIIYHLNKQTMILRGFRAQEAKANLDASAFGEQQQFMARLTGNYKRGNERTAKNHPRNVR